MKNYLAAGIILFGNWYFGYVMFGVIFKTWDQRKIKAKFKVGDFVTEKIGEGFTSKAIPTQLQEIIEIGKTEYFVRMWLRIDNKRWVNNDISLKIRIVDRGFLPDMRMKPKKDILKIVPFEQPETLQ